MLIRISEDRIGNVWAEPVNARIAARMIADAIENGAPRDFEAVAFLQQPSIEEVQETFGRGAIFRSRYTDGPEVNDGAVVRIDEWAFRHMLGYCND